MMQIEWVVKFLFTVLTETIALFVIINPMVNAAVFQEMVPDYNVRQKAVKTATKIAFAILIVFGLAGGTILIIMGISIDAFRVAGGVLLLRLSLSLITGEEIKTKAEDVAIVPMATPLLAGPGAISTTIVLVHNEGVLETLLAIVLAVTAAWLFMSESDRLVRKVGRRGLVAFGRVMAMLTAALSIQFIFTGIVEYFGLALSPGG